jgi:hypothetical protein
LSPSENHDCIQSQRNAQNERKWLLEDHGNSLGFEGQQAIPLDERHVELAIAYVLYEQGDDFLNFDDK